MRILVAIVGLTATLGLLGAPARAAQPTPAPAQRLWSVGFRSGYATWPNFVLGAIYDRYVPVNGYFFEGVVGRRFGGFRLYASLTVTRAGADRGVWQRGPSKTPSEVEIDLTALSADVLFDWEVRLHRRFALHFGAGLGLGTVFGTLRSQDCVILGGSCVVPPNAPYDDKKSDVWPVLPILHLVAGARIDLTARLSLRVDFDFRDAFGVAAGIFWEL